MIKIAASTHLAKSNLKGYVEEVEKAGVDLIHFDVMDGVFVKDKTINHEQVFEINSLTTMVLDVHLMVDEPYFVINDYITAGADIITIHYEAFQDKNELLKALELIRKSGLVAGLSLKPSVDIKELIPFLEEVDLVLLMSVNPGASGQEFLKESIDKIKWLKSYKEINNLYYLIEVDGGVNLSNSNKIIAAGADIVVMGSALYNTKDKALLIEQIKKG